jgi:hypothetical protein
MSEEQVEVVREHIEAYRRQDASVALSCMDQHAVLDMSRVDGSDPSHGHKAIDEAVTHYRGTFEDYDYKVERLTDLGSGAILAVHADRPKDRAGHAVRHGARRPRSRRAAGVVRPRGWRTDELPERRCPCRARGVS